MADIKIAKGHELRYWNDHKDEPYSRAQKMIDLFGLSAMTEVNVMSDVGCGPRGGVFHLVKAKHMYAVDPLWNDYKQKGLDVVPDGVTTINKDASSFVLPKLANVIVSVNALDHSGDLKGSVENIMGQLVADGVFHLHIHMRTAKQLNKAHRMLIKEKDLDGMLSGYDFLHRNIYDQCPIEDKPYRSYVASVRKK